MAALANIRHVERERLRGLLLPGHLVQVSGPPMVGKLTVVNQVLRDMGSTSRLQDSLSPTPHAGPFIQHRFSCQSAAGGLSVLANMAAKLERPLQGWEDLNSATAAVLGDLRAAVLLADQGRGAPCHHIFVFEKCESLVTRDADFWFLGFLSALMRALASHLVTVVFTSYKRFQWGGGGGGDGFPGNRDRLVYGPVQDGDGHVCWTLEIGQLMDIDILSLLQHFAPAVNPSPYLYIFQRFLGFPEAVRKVAQTFLLGRTVGAALSSASLETVVKTDYAFLHSVFSSRLGEVMDWVGWENLLLLRHFGNSLDSSATMECLQTVATGDLDPVRWSSLCLQLTRCYVIRELPGLGRLAVHPLVIYFCRTQLRAILVALRGHETNLFSNRFTHFLCATLSSLDACSALKGRQLAVVSSMLHECPNIRHVINMALLASEDSYEVYLKLALCGGGMLSLLCPREVITFFACLYKRSKVCGRGLTERAILRGLYGQALAWGAGVHWQESTEHLTEAITALSRPGLQPSYYLLLFLAERAKIHARQSKYDLALRGFERARALFGRVQTHALGEKFAVTEAKLRETELTTCVYETVPMIFKGNNAAAKQRLLMLVELLEQEFPNSVELPTAYNQLGLSEQRGRSSAESTERAMECYLICLRLRTYFLKINPIPLYAPYNNVSMLCYRSNDLGQFYALLEKALQISREFDWLHYYTGLTLVHLAEGSIGRGHFLSALLYLKEADRVLTITARDHHLRHRTLLELAHVMIALSPNSTHHRALQPEHQTHACEGRFHRDGELVPSTVGMCKPISQDDLNKSAKYYLERITEVARNMNGTLSDDGHHFILSAYEHALSLNWGNAEEVDKFTTLIFDHVETNNFVELFEEKMPEKHHNLYKHKNVYWYLKECRNTSQKLDLETFLAKQVPACTICAYGHKYFTTDVWLREITALVDKQQRLKALSVSLSTHDTSQSSGNVFPTDCSDHTNLCRDQHWHSNGHNIVKGHSINSSQILDCPSKTEPIISPHNICTYSPSSPNKNIVEKEQYTSAPSTQCKFAGLGPTHPGTFEIPCSGDTRSSSGDEDVAQSYCNSGDLPRFDQIAPSSASAEASVDTGPNSSNLYILQGIIHPASSPKPVFLQQVNPRFSDVAASSQSQQRLCREPIEHTEPLGFLPVEEEKYSNSRRQPVEDEEDYVDLNTRGTVFSDTYQRINIQMPVEDIWPTSSQQIGSDSSDEYIKVCNNPPTTQNKLVLNGNFYVSNTKNKEHSTSNGPNLCTYHGREKAPLFKAEHSNILRGMEELTLSRDLKYQRTGPQSGSDSEFTSSGHGSMIKSSTDGMPSAPGSFLSQVDQRKDIDTCSVQHQMHGARPKTSSQMSGKKQCNSKNQ